MAVDSVPSTSVGSRTVRFGLVTVADEYLPTITISWTFMPLFPQNWKFCLKKNLRGNGLLASPQIGDLGRRPAANVGIWGASCSLNPSADLTREMVCCDGSAKSVS